MALTSRRLLCCYASDIQITTLASRLDQALALESEHLVQRRGTLDSLLQNLQHKDACLVRQLQTLLCDCHLDMFSASYHGSPRRLACFIVLCEQTGHKQIAKDAGRGKRSCTVQCLSFRVFLSKRLLRLPVVIPFLWHTWKLVPHL